MKHAYFRSLGTRIHSLPESKHCPVFIGPGIECFTELGCSFQFLPKPQSVPTSLVGL